MKLLNKLLVALASVCVMAGTHAVEPDIERSTVALASAERPEVYRNAGAALPTVGVASESSTNVPRAAERQPGGRGLRLLVAAVPEPGNWMLLLSGLVVVAVIARRKTSGLSG